MWVKVLHSVLDMVPHPSIVHQVLNLLDSAVEVVHLSEENPLDSTAASFHPDFTVQAQVATTKSEAHPTWDNQLI